MSENKIQMRQIVLMTMILFLTVPVFAQKERKFIREGNRDFAKGLEDTTSLDTVSFGKAEVAYRRALEEKPDNFQWKFNLADALYKQAKPAKAAEEFEQLTKETDNSKEKAMVYHNLGNSLLAQKKIDESIDAYKKSLRLNPNDMETKYNLAYAEKMKQQQKNKKKNKQNQQDKNNKDKNKNNQDKNKQNKDQNKNNKDKQNQDQKKNQDQNKQNQNKQNQNQQQQQQQPQQNKISKQNAEQMLQALQNDEKKTQEKVRKLKAKKAQQYKIEKDW